MVSIHALLAECDRKLQRLSYRIYRFNPRTPCGVRLCVVPLQPCNRDVSIHALLAECDGPFDSFRVQILVSIHALLAECDTLANIQFSFFTPFQSTHSLRSATGQMSSSLAFSKSFNPRTPCGVRLIDLLSLKFKVRFQSTHSLRSATESCWPFR